MRTIRELVGECPLGALIKETKIDTFGFYAGHKFIKMVRKDFYYNQIFGDYSGRGLSYCDLRYYGNIDGYREVE